MKTMLITGISKGLGNDILNNYIDDYIIIGLSRNKPNMKHKNFYYYKTDLSNYNSIKNTFKKINKKFDNIDVLINNAGMFLLKRFIDHKKKDIDNIIKTNLLGHIYCTREVLKLMKTGKIIFINSVAGINAIKNQSIYSASKCGLIGFANSLSQELNNINVSIINPGGLNTTLWNANNPYPGKNRDKLINTTYIIDIIDYIIKMPYNIILKDLTIFPKHEWH